MAAFSPHYYLIPEAEQTPSGGRWKFALLSKAGRESLSAEEFEPGEKSAARLALTALARGLEALDGPARVTVLATDQHIQQGLSHGLEEWKANAWQWERFEEWTPVKNADLWRRVDRAMDFLDVRCIPRPVTGGLQPHALAGFSSDAPTPSKLPRTRRPYALVGKEEAFREGPSLRTPGSRLVGYSDPHTSGWTPRPTPGRFSLAQSRTDSGELRPNAWDDTLAKAIAAGLEFLCLAPWLTGKVTLIVLGLPLRLLHWLACVSQPRKTVQSTA